MDQIPSFEVCRGAISHMLDPMECGHVIAEGLLASGVYGSWGEYSAQLRAAGHAFAFCYLHAPLEVCVERVRRRHAAAGRPEKQINWGNLEAKWHQVVANRARALAAGELVYDLPFEDELAALIKIMAGQGDEYRAQ
jgi:hypothetical protein